MKQTKRHILINSASIFVSKLYRVEISIPEHIGLRRRLRKFDTSPIYAVHVANFDVSFYFIFCSYFGE